MFLFEVNHVLQEKETLEQNILSPEYHTFLNFFSEQEAKELLLYRNYDDKISRKYLKMNPPLDPSIIYQIQS